MIGAAKAWRRLWILHALVLVACLVGCAPSWGASLSRPDGSAFPVDAAVLRGLEEFAEPVQGQQAIPLERVLVSAGHAAVDSLWVETEDGAAESGFEWESVADRAWWFSDGNLLIGESRLRASQVKVEPSALLPQVVASITDITPTACAALGLPLPSQATGSPLDAGRADRVALIFMDGFGHVRYTEALAEGLIPRLEALGEPLLALTTYPPITSVSTASLLTGAPPSAHGVDTRGIRKTETETLFDVAASAGLKVVAVEGESLSFALRNADLQLSADFDGNGSTDDNVLTNALGVLSDGAPDLLFVHFHGIDDAGHSYGPGAGEERAVIQEEDEAVGRIVESLPQGTLVIIFADHGMHEVNEEGRLGNHGHLFDRDMYVPIFLVRK
jgi:hypothetical protein